MNKILAILFILTPLAGIAYSLWRTWHILPFGGVARWTTMGVMLVCLLIFFAVPPHLHHFSFPCR